MGYGMKCLPDCTSGSAPTFLILCNTMLFICIIISWDFIVEYLRSCYLYYWSSNIDKSVYIVRCGQVNSRALVGSHFADIDLEFLKVFKNMKTVEAYSRLHAGDVKHDVKHISFLAMFSYFLNFLLTSLFAFSSLM